MWRQMLWQWSLASARRGLQEWKLNYKILIVGRDRDKAWSSADRMADSIDQLKTRVLQLSYRSFGEVRTGVILSAQRSAAARSKWDRYNDGEDGTVDGDHASEDGEWRKILQSGTPTSGISPRSSYRAREPNLVATSPAGGGSGKETPCSAGTREREVDLRERDVDLSVLDTRVSLDSGQTTPISPNSPYHGGWQRVESEKTANGMDKIGKKAAEAPETPSSEC